MFKFGFAEDAAGTAEGRVNRIFGINLETHVPVHNLRLKRSKVIFPRIFNSFLSIFMNYARAKELFIQINFRG